MAFARGGLPRHSCDRRVENRFHPVRAPEGHLPTPRRLRRFTVSRLASARGSPTRSRTHRSSGPPGSRGGTSGRTTYATIARRFGSTRYRVVVGNRSFPESRCYGIGRILVCQWPETVGEPRASCSRKRTARRRFINSDVVSSGLRGFDT